MVKIGDYFSKSFLRMAIALPSALAILTINIFGYVSIIPFEIRSLIDAQFVFSYSLLLTRNVLLSGLLAKTMVILFFPISYQFICKWSGRRNPNARKFSLRRFRIFRVWTRKKSGLFTLSLSVFLFFLFQLGWFFFYGAMALTMMFLIVIFSVGEGRSAAFPKLNELTQKQSNNAIYGLILGLSFASYMAGYITASSNLFNYVEIVSGDTRTKGALLGSTGSGVFLVEGYDARSNIRRQSRHILFIPFESYDYIWTRERTFEVTSTR